MLRNDSPVLSDRLPESRLFQDAVDAAFFPTNGNLMHWLSWILAIGAQLSLLLVLSAGRVAPWEVGVARDIQALADEPVLGIISAALAGVLGLPLILLFLAVTAFLALRGRRESASLLLVGFPVYILAQLPAAIADRPQPSPEFAGLHGIGGFESTAAADAGFAVAFYGFVAYLLVLRATRDWQRTVILWSWVALVTGTGLAVVAEGAGWPLDVIASYFLGLGLLSGLMWLHSAFRCARSEHPEEERQHYAVTAR